MECPLCGGTLDPPNYTGLALHLVDRHAVEPTRWARDDRPQLMVAYSRSIVQCWCGRCFETRPRVHWFGTHLETMGGIETCFLTRHLVGGD